MLSLSHYSSDPDLRLSPFVTYQGQVEHYADKPSGLWVSVDGEDSWEQWCNSDCPGLLGTYRYDVRLADDANLLHLHGAYEMLAFDQEYSRDCAYFRCPDWADVAERYQGIIIAPYVWSMRLDDRCRWYYGWDCASGCIWDPAAIEEIACSSGSASTTTTARLPARRSSTIPASGA